MAVTSGAEIVFQFGTHKVTFIFSEVAFAHFVQLHICVDIIGGIVDHHCSSILFIISQINFHVRYPRINNVRLLRCCR
jgi:hypothetical protein